jgi:RNA polymerase sigma-70 factor (ECF subfamily)
VRTAYLIVRDREAAEDAAQDAFSQLYVHWAKVSKYEQPQAWVRRVAIRIAIRTARRDSRRHLLSRESATPADSGRTELDLMPALGTLPPQQRAAVVLFYFEDRPTEEIGRILGCSTSTAKVHLFKARQKLAGLLGRTGEEGLDVH